MTINRLGRAISASALALGLTMALAAPARAEDGGRTRSSAPESVATPSVHYTWGYVTGTAYYNREETRRLKTESFGAGVAAGLCGYFGAATAGASCVIGAAVYAQWAYVSDNAYDDGKCVKIRIPTFWAYAYEGKDCY